MRDDAAQSKDAHCRTRAFTQLTDSQLLEQCEVDTYRASGPGGQKRNKTSSAVRLRHLPSGLLVIAEESRSQHENRARALKRLRQAFFLKIREPVERRAEDGGRRAEEEFPLSSVLLPSSFISDGRLHLGRKDARFWPAAGLVLDVLAATEARVADAAKLLGISTGNLIDFLRTDPKVWEQANQLRQKFGHKPLRRGLISYKRSGCWRHTSPERKQRDSPRLTRRY